MCAGWRAAGSKPAPDGSSRGPRGRTSGAPSNLSAVSKAALSICASSISCGLLITAFSPCTVVLIIPDLADSSP